MTGSRVFCKSLNRKLFLRVFLFLFTALLVRATKATALFVHATKGSALFVRATKASPIKSFGYGHIGKQIYTSMKKSRERLREK